MAFLFRRSKKKKQDPPVPVQKALVPIDGQTGPDHDHLCKILLAGSDGIGIKTRMMNFLRGYEPDVDYISTIGVDIITYTLTVDGAVVKAQIAGLFIPGRAAND